MKSYLKNYFWFWKESFSFMQGHNRFYIAWRCLLMSHGFAFNMYKWEKLTPEEQEVLYLSEDRTMEF